jgi:hypothetical protein
LSKAIVAFVLMVNVSLSIKFVRIGRLQGCAIAEFLHEQAWRGRECSRRPRSPGVLPPRPFEEMSFTMRKKRREAVARRLPPLLFIATDIFAKVGIKG